MTLIGDRPDDPPNNPFWGSVYRCRLFVSSPQRAGSLAADWYFLGRVRSFDEIQSAIDSLTPDGIVAHLRRCPPRDFTIVTLGPKELQVPNAGQ